MCVCVFFFLVFARRETLDDSFDVLVLAIGGRAVAIAIAASKTIMLLLPVRFGFFLLSSN